MGGGGGGRGNQLRICSSCCAVKQNSTQTVIMIVILMLYVQQEGEAEKFVEELAVEVSSRLQAIGMKGRNLTLKLMVRRPDAPAETAKFMGRFVVFQLLKPPSLWGFFFVFQLLKPPSFLSFSR